MWAYGVCIYHLGKTAKSLWNKWNRKMHAKKRKKNAPKEFIRPESILKVDSDVLMKVQEMQQ
jgi:hypothetical protein